MPELSKPLQFYVKHACDVGALWAEEDKPDGVAPEEWTMFREVLHELKYDADALLRRLSGPLEDGQLTGFTAIGRRPYKIHESWDYHRQLKPSRKGNLSAVGYAGIQIIDEPAGGVFFVAYASALAFARPDAPGVGDRCPDELKKTLADKLVVASLKLAPDTTEEELAQLVTNSVPHLIAYPFRGPRQ